MPNALSLLRIQLMTAFRACDDGWTDGGLVAQMQELL